VPSYARSPSSLREELPGSDSEAWKSRVLASYAGQSDSNSDSEPTDDDPNLEYVRLKLQLSELSQGKDREGQAQDLLSRIEDVKQHYFFRAKDAERRYRAEQDKVDSESLKLKLRGLPETPVESGTTSPTKRRPPNLKPSASVKDDTDVFNGSSDDEPVGGMFEILQEMPTTETTDEGTTVTVRDMALPKHWSGRTPKILLLDAVTKKDRYAITTYRCVSGSSRVKRAAVSIRWEGRKTQEWVMEDTGCHDMAQAEQFVATIALHSLTFPKLEGFALGSTAASGNQTFFRLLPAVFRDLWDELEDKRKADDDAFNRSLWSKLRTIVEPKLETSRKVGDPKLLPKWLC
jgi:ATP-dependent RNA helicase DHX29